MGRYKKAHSHFQAAQALASRRRSCQRALDGVHDTAYMPYACDLDNLKDIAGQHLTQISDSINAINCNIDIKKHIRLIGICVRKCVLAGIEIPQYTLAKLQNMKCIQYHSIMNATSKAERSRVRLLSK